MFRRFSAYLLLPGCLLFAISFALILAHRPMRGTPFPGFPSRAASSMGQAVALQAQADLKPPLQGSYHYADGRILLNLKPQAGQKVQVMVSRLSGKAVFLKQWEVIQPNFREEVNLAYLPEGMYLIEIQAGPEKMSQMLIK